MRHLTTSLLLFLAACTPVQGSGRLATEARTVSEFDRVSIGGGLEATVSIGERAVEIRADDNLLQYVEATVRDGKLVVGTEPGFLLQPTTRIRVAVTVPALEGVEASGGADVVAAATPATRFTVAASGAGTVKVTGIDADRVSADASGAGRLELQGATERLELELSGGSQAALAQLEALDVEVNLSAGSRAELVATESVAGDLSGGSTLRVNGRPDVRDVCTSGGSDVLYR